MKQRLLKLAILAATVFIFMFLVAAFGAAALYLYLSTQIGGVYAALVIAGLAFVFLGGAVFAVVRLVAKMRFGIRAMLGTAALGAVGPSMLKRAAGATPLGSLAAMGFSYWAARRKNRAG